MQHEPPPPPRAAADVKVYGGPRDGAALTYRQACFAIARGELDGYAMKERPTLGTNEEFLYLLHYTWMRRNNDQP